METNENSFAIKTFSKQSFTNQLQFPSMENIRFESLP